MNIPPRVYALPAIAALIIVPLFAAAAEFKTGDQPSHASGETIADDLYMAGGSVISAGSVQGDLVGAGGNVLITGPVSQDLIAAGGAVTILSNVGDDLRVAGGNITIQGTVAGDLLAGGGQIVLGGSRIGGDVAIGAGTLRIDAPIGGDVKIAGGEVYINAAIGGDVEIQADKITLGEKAALAGDFSYSSPKEAVMEEGATVAGETTYKKSSDMGKAAQKGFAAFLSIVFLAKMFSIFICALIVGYFFRRYSREMVARAGAQPWWELGRGLIFAIMTPIVSILLLFTLVGIPFGAFGLVAFIGALIFAAIATPIVVGSIVHKWIWKPAEYEISWKTTLLGTLLYFLVGLVPFIGWAVCFAAMMIALGSAIGIKAEIAKEWR